MRNWATLLLILAAGLFGINFLLVLIAAQAALFVPSAPPTTIGVEAMECCWRAWEGFCVSFVGLLLAFIALTISRRRNGMGRGNGGGTSDPGNPYASP